MSGTSAKEQTKAQLQLSLIQCLWVETPQALHRTRIRVCREASSPALQCWGLGRSAGLWLASPLATSVSVPGWSSYAFCAAYTEASQPLPSLNFGNSSEGEEKSSACLYHRVSFLVPLGMEAPWDSPSSKCVYSWVSQPGVQGPDGGEWRAGMSSCGSLCHWRWLGGEQPGSSDTQGSNNWAERSMQGYYEMG